MEIRNHLEYIGERTRQVLLYTAAVKGPEKAKVQSQAQLQSQGYGSLNLTLTPGPDFVAVMTYIPVRFEDVGYSLDGHTHTHTHMRVPSQSTTNSQSLFARCSAFGTGGSVG